MATPLDARLKDVQALLSSILEERGENAAPSHWELPVLPPPDAEGRLSSTDLLNWWFRAPHRSWSTPAATPAEIVTTPERPPARGPDDAASRDVWTELSVLLPEPEEHLADEHAQSAVDCLYDFLHALGQRDLEAASALVDEHYHCIEDGQEVNKAKFVNAMAFHLDALQAWDFEVSLAVAPEPVSHPYGVLVQAIVQFDAVRRADGLKDGRVEERVAIVREDESGSWKIAALSKVRG